MAATCVSTVRTLTNSAAATSRLVAPAAIKSATRCSAAVSLLPERAAATSGELGFDLGRQGLVADPRGQLMRVPQGSAGLLHQGGGKLRPVASATNWRTRRHSPVRTMSSATCVFQHTLAPRGIRALRLIAGNRQAVP